MAATDAPTITATDVSVVIGTTEYAGVAGTETGDIVVHVPYSTPAVANVKLKMAASAAGSLFLSNVAGTDATCAIPATTAAVLVDSDSHDVIFNVGGAYGAQGFCFYVTLAATTEIPETPAEGQIGAYKIFIIDDLDKVVAKNSYSAALGALVTYDISKFKYVSNGIDIKADKGGLTVVGYNIKGGYIPYVEFSSGKLILYKAIGTQADANTEIYGQVTVLKR